MVQFCCLFSDSVHTPPPHTPNITSFSSTVSAFHHWSANERLATSSSHAKWNTKKTTNTQESASSTHAHTHNHKFCVFCPLSLELPRLEDYMFSPKTSAVLSCFVFFHLLSLKESFHTQPVSPLIRPLLFFGHACNVDSGNQTCT